MLGFDVDPKHATKLPANWTEHCETDAKSDETRNAEDGILNILVDICSLFQRQPLVNGSTGGEAPSAENYLFSYLRCSIHGARDFPSRSSARCVARWPTMGCKPWSAHPNWKKV